MTVTSSTKTSTYGWMSPLFKMRKWLGPRVVQNLKANAYMIENEPYEATLAVEADQTADRAEGGPIIRSGGFRRGRCGGCGWCNSCKAGFWGNGHGCC